MLKREKLDILNELISRTNELKYNGNSPHRQVVDDTLSFLRNTISKENADRWSKRINLIHWSLMAISSMTPQDDYINAWESGRQNFLGVLNSIKKEIELYENDGTPSASQNEEYDRSPVIFLSHASIDKKYADALEKFIIGLGVKNNQLIYTSHALHKIPLDANIFDYLRKNIYKKIFMIILWSDTYLESPACLNEMGAVWVTQSDYTNIFTPTFHFENPKFHECAVDTRKMGAILNGDAHCKASMIEFKNKIQSLFELTNDEAQVSYLLDEFIQEIKEIMRGSKYMSKPRFETSA